LRRKTTATVGKSRCDVNAQNGEGLVKDLSPRRHRDAAKRRSIASLRQRPEDRRSLGARVTTF